MKQKTIFLLSLLVAFFLGVLATYLIMTKQQMDQIMQARQQAAASTVAGRTESSQPLTATVSSDVAAQQAPAISGIQTNANINKDAKESVSINDYTQQQALQMVNNMPDYVLGQYIDKFMAKDASDVITDKRRFAQRAIEELYTPNDNQPMVGEVKLSLDPSMPASSIDTSSINKNAKLYAHLDTRGQVPSSPYVFVKWVNNETGQVLLFEKKDIVADSNQNWVSFRPYDGWQAGSYDIRFYQFTSELQPVAQLTYHIYSVVE